MHRDLQFADTGWLGEMIDEQGDRTWPRHGSGHLEAPGPVLQSGEIAVTLPEGLRGSSMPIF